jgi:hypothetical protein
MIKIVSEKSFFCNNSYISVGRFNSKVIGISMSRPKHVIVLAVIIVAIVTVSTVSILFLNDIYVKGLYSAKPEAVKINH